MKRRLFSLVVLVATTVIMTSFPIRAAVWFVASPDHGQTYAYGSEDSRVWKALGSNRHLALLATYSNDPYAEGPNRRYDYFTFNFPHVKLGSDGQTFYYRSPEGHALPVASRESGLFGVEEIRLLTTSYLIVAKEHGYLSLTLAVGDRPFEPNPDVKVGFEH